MASTKRTRQVTSRRFDTIILKDLQSLRKWSEGLPNPGKGRDQYFSNLLDDDRLLCDEKLEDLEDVWARPPRPKRPDKTKSKRSRSMISSQPEDVDDVCAIPLYGKRARKAQSKRSQTPLHKILPRPLDPASPVAPSIVPPNSPAELSPAGQSNTSNPYITYLIQSWEAGSPVLVTSTDSPIQTSVSAGAANGPIVQCVHDDETNMMMVHPDDVLVIPDSSREDFSTKPHAAIERTGEESTQCVPQAIRSLQHNHSQSTDMGEESLFNEEELITPEPSHDTLEQQDHVVPHF